MPFHNFENQPSNFFLKIKKNNLSKWEKIENKKKKELEAFLKECTKKNNDIQKNLQPEQHYLINKN